MKIKLFLLLIAVSLFPAGCTLAPKYERPAMPTPADWPKGAAYQEIQTTTVGPAAPEMKWQEFFPDEKLQKVIAMALKNNSDLRLAVLNVERARALYGIQRAELLPAVNAVGSMSRQRVPADLSSDGKAMTVEQYGVNLGVSSWEIDFFGRIRSLKDRMLEEYLATEQAGRSARILLVSTVANAYLALAADQENLKLASSTLEAQQTTYHLIRRRYDVGLASELDLHRAQIQVETAKGDVARFTQLVAQDENAMNLLIGSPTPDALLPTQLGSITPFREISIDVSSEILLRRPDILAVEHRLKAANANIGAARAAFFPALP